MFEFMPDEDAADVDIKECAPVRNTIEELKRLGLDTEAALGFCGGDISFYEELLSDFVTSYEGKRKELDESFHEKDWHEFEVKIHALKSVTKTIGATELSALALELERAAAELDENYIMDGYPKFVSGYKGTAERITVLLAEGTGMLVGYNADRTEQIIKEE